MPDTFFSLLEVISPIHTMDPGTSGRSVPSRDTNNTEFTTRPPHRDMTIPVGKTHMLVVNMKNLSGKTDMLVVNMTIPGKNAEMSGKVIGNMHKGYIKVGQKLKIVVTGDEKDRKCCNNIHTSCRFPGLTPFFLDKWDRKLYNLSLRLNSREEG